MNSFIESLYTKSFFDEEKLIIINRGSDKILEIIKDLVFEKNYKTKIIIKSNILEKKSKLRNFFEKDKMYFVFHFMKIHFNL